MISQPIYLGLVVPDLTPQIKYVRVHLKSVICIKFLSDIKILWVCDQYSLGWFGIIPMSWDLEC